VAVTPGAGAAIGGAIGFLLGGPVGAGLGAIVGGSMAHVSGDAPFGVMTPKRQLIYARAIECIKNPDELRLLADAFQGEGLHAQAATLRRRAELGAVTPEARQKRRQAFEKAMASSDPKAVSAVAKAFKETGSVGVGQALEGHAQAVRAALYAERTGLALPPANLQAFASKLTVAVERFGPESKHAAMAAINLLRAGGTPPTHEVMLEAIRMAKSALPALPPSTVASATAA
jgi:hypothetical protein